MTRSLHFGSVAVAVAAWSGGAAWAQEFRTNLRLGADAEYESNLLRANAMRDGGNSSDMRVTPTIDLDIARPIGRNRLAIGGALGYDFYRRNSFLNRERIRLDSSADLALGAFCQADLTAGLDFQQTDIADLGERIGNTSRQQSFGGTLDCTRRTGLSPSVSLRHTAVDNSIESRRRFDLRSDDLSAGIAYAKPSVGVAQLFVSIRRIGHPLRPRPNGRVGDETRVTSAGLSVRRSVAPRFGFSAQVAWLKTEQREAGVPSFSGLGWTTSVRWAPFPRFRASATLDRSIRGESSFGADYTITTSNGIDLDYRVGERTSVSAGLAQRRRVFRGESFPGGPAPRGWDDTWVATAGGDYTLFRNLGLRARVGYRRRGAADPLYRYNSTSALVGARLRL